MKAWGRAELPGARALKRWRRQCPEFAAALHSAARVGHRLRMRARRMLTPELAEEIAGRIVDGASLRAVGQAPDMPGYLALAQRLFTSDANVRNVKAFFAIKRAKFEPRIPLARPKR